MLIDMKMFQILLTLLNIKYTWGGNVPETGLDCSGLILIALKAYGVVEQQADLTAQGIYHHLTNQSHQMVDIHNSKENDIIFYGKSDTRISHIAMFINSWQIIHAQGGNRHTTNAATAAKQKAFVKITPARYRDDIVAIVRLNL
jgi:cell wall-associated NlpC family hydrolase